jgi:hypothetical protein
MLERNKYDKQAWEWIDKKFPAQNKTNSNLAEIKQFLKQADDLFNFNTETESFSICLGGSWSRFLEPLLRIVN